MSLRLNANVEHYTYHEACITKDASSQRKIFRRNFFERNTIDRYFASETLDQGVWIFVINSSSKFL